MVGRAGGANQAAVRKNCQPFLGLTVGFSFLGLRFLGMNSPITFL